MTSKIKNILTFLITKDPYERSKIADALKPLKFKKGEYVVREVIFFSIGISKKEKIVNI